MEGIYCGVCGRTLDDDSTNICAGCGESVCYHDYDNLTGFCINCFDNSPYCGC